MNNNSSSGIVGVVLLVGAAVLAFVTKDRFPLISTILFVIGIILALLVLLIIVLVIVFSKSGSKNKNDGIGDVEEQVLRRGREHLMTLRRLVMRVKNKEVRSLGDGICSAIDKILRTLKEQPENISAVRQFFNYYLPTLGGILQKYVRLEEGGIPGEEITLSTVECLRNITAAMDKQYKNLFEDDILNLSVEMEALTIACKRDGLLSGEELCGTDNKFTL